MSQQQLPAKSKMEELKGMIAKAMPSMNAVIPKHVTAERLAKIAMVAASRNPILNQCTALSIVNSLMDASALGLEPSGPLGLAYLVPFKNNKIGAWEAQFMPSYKGLIDLARRSGNIKSIEAHVVREKDHFECSFGIEPKLVHIPAWDCDDPGFVRLVYAVARLTDGGTQVEVMTKSEVEKVRRSSRAAESGPWQQWPEEMAKKTVIKRLCKMLPMSVELAKAVEKDNAADTGEPFIDIDTVSEDDFAPPADEKPQSKTDALADKLGA